MIKKEKQKNNGITLIALVITIVVLLSDIEVKENASGQWDIAY